MTPTELLWYSGAAVAAEALVFFGAGLVRTIGWKARGVACHNSANTTELTRLRTVRRADWECGTALLVIALSAVAIGALFEEPRFSEPTGNIEGAILLIALAVALIVILAVIVRHARLTRALRELDD